MSYTERTKEWEPDPEKSENIAVCGMVNHAIASKQANLGNLTEWITKAQEAWRSRLPYVSPEHMEAEKLYKELSPSILNAKTIEELNTAANAIAANKTQLLDDHVEALKGQYLAAKSLLQKTPEETEKA